MRDRWGLGRFRGRFRIRKDTIRSDAVAGLVLGVQSVPDGLATGLLAGVNPLAGLYGYMVGTITGAISTSSTFMVVQGTGAMAMVIADVDAIHNARNPARMLFTLSVLTGAVMLVAGLLKLGSVLRFVSNAVMVGFINAVGVNIVLGQLSNLTGYSAPGENRVTRAVRTIISPGELHWQSVAIGLATIGLILLFERTPVGSLGLVVAVVITSGAVALFGWSDVATLHDLGVALGDLPTPTWPLFGQVPVLLIPALSLAFVGLVQGAGISASFVNPDGTTPDASGDFVGQGVANVASGLLQGMPVGGSVSASSLNRTAGARTRYAAIVAGLTMAVATVALGGVIDQVAMPALAGLLILVGARTIHPDDLRSVWRIGVVQKIVLGTTFVLTMVIPLQYAVLVGVGLSVVLHVVRQSNQITIQRWERDDAGHVIERDPPTDLPAGEVVVLQPYGSLFFAAAPVFEAALPAVSDASSRTVVILRLRGRTDLGTTFMDVVARYAQSLRDVGSKLVIVSATERIQQQLDAAGVTAIIGTDDIHLGNERVGATLERAVADANEWIRRAPGPQ